MVEKARANFCEYFEPQSGAYQARDESPAAKAKVQLDALFGAGPGETQPDPARAELDKLFGKPKN